MLFSEIFNAYPALLVAGCLLLGLIVGSFLNVVIYRLPRIMERQWRAECELLLAEGDARPAPQPASTEEKYSLAFPASHCPRCQHSIRPWHNIPVLSWLLLRGRCAHCQAAIGARYPVVELASGLLAAWAAVEFGFGWELPAILILLWGLLSLTAIDIDHQLLPDQLTLPLLWLGLLVNSQTLLVPLHDALWGAATGYLVLWSVYHLFRLLTGKEGMGYGDFKLLAALGAWLGWQMLPLIILLSSLVGAVCGIVLLTLQRKGHGTPIPFGPYLAAAGVIALFWGEQLIDRYLQFAGL